MTAMPKIANAMCIALPTPAALIASGPSGPTITVSTTPIVIQPSSAITTGTAILSMGRNSVRIERHWREVLILVGLASEPVMRYAGASHANDPTHRGARPLTRRPRRHDASKSAASPGSGFTTVLSSAMRYAMNYEQRFALLAADEQYVQELQRPPNPGSNLSRSNPGGGMQGGGAISQQTIKSDFLLVQLGGDGEGFMPFRDAYEAKGRKLRDRDDRLLKLFTKNDKGRFEKAAAFSSDSAKHNLGNVTRTINIPLLAMMFLHPRVNERFEFTDGGEETMAGRVLRKAIYKEVARPTLIKTSRGRDLAMTGTIWIDPFSGTVVKTELNAADPVVRTQVTVTFRRDEALDLWVPDKMEEYYKAYSALDDILATATYTNVRKILKSDLEP